MRNVIINDMTRTCVCRCMEMVCDSTNTLFIYYITGEDAVQLELRNNGGQVRETYHLQANASNKIEIPWEWIYTDAPDSLFLVDGDNNRVMTFVLSDTIINDNRMSLGISKVDNETFNLFCTPISKEAESQLTGDLLDQLNGEVV